MAEFAESHTPYQTSRFSEGNHTARSVTEEAGDRFERAADSVVTTVKDYPVATLAVAVGLAFAIGALWKAGRPRPSRWEALQSNLRDLPSTRQLKSYWR